jgi:GT2 family glycosyltransferase
MDSEFPDFKIVVVDNGSSDDSVEKISKAYPDMTLLSLPENLGFAGGYNYGIENAQKGDASFYFLLNNDTVLDKKAIGALINSPWDISVPKITYYDNPDMIWAAGARWRLFPPTIKMIGYRKQDSKTYNQPHQLDYATGCALMVKQHVFKTVPGFDPIYINYMEDYDFCYRVRKAGYSMGYVPEAKVQHKVSLSLGPSSPQRWHFIGRNTVLFYHQGDRFPRYTLWSVLGWIFLREILQGNATYLPSIWSGVREGMDISKGIFN